MRTNHKNQLIAIPHFEGCVTDPETGRKCALQRDIAAGLSLSDSQVVLAKGRVYQSRFLDIEDVVKNRAAGKSRGRPRKHPKGIIIGELAGIIAACVVGLSLASGVIAFIGETTAPILREAVGHPNQLVIFVEANGISGAKEAREQWDARRAIVIECIGSLETLTLEKP